MEGVIERTSKTATTGRSARLVHCSRRICFHSIVMATKNNDRGASLLAADLALVYTPPRSAIRRFFWKWRVRFESTFALSMFEGWEKILVGASSLLLGDVNPRI